ncbi:MAG: polyprenol monophosphomannose synthase [Candidatus Acidiferrales bacterium]
MPTYNEAQNLPRLLPLIFAEAANIPTHELHVLVVDDDSPDGTGERVRAAMRLYPRLHLMTGRKKGLGEAYKRGIARAIATIGPDLIVQMDADFQHDPAMLPQLVRLCNEGYDLVIGSRFVSGTEIAGLAWHRRFISVAGTRLVRWFGHIPPLTDCTSGYRCIRAALIPKCDFGSYSTRGYSFQSWFLCELLRNGARHIEIPLAFPIRAYGSSKLSLRDKVEFVWSLLHLPFRKRVPSRETHGATEPSLGATEGISSKAASHSGK